MNEVFGKTEQKRLVFNRGAFDQYVQAVSELPNVETTDVGICRLLTVPSEDHPAGIVYIVREINGSKVWQDISTLDEPAIVWEDPKFWKRITPDAIILHWDDPTDESWNHTVIVRKRNEVPQLINDGEIVGYSSVRNRFNKESKGFPHALFPEDTDYYYRLFAVNHAGIATPSPTWVKSAWTWDEISATIYDNMHEYCFRVGDIFPLPNNICFDGKTIHARIVDFNYSKIPGGTTPKSITFLTEEVLGTMSFNNKELMYALTNDKSFIADKSYFIKNEETGKMDEFDWIAEGFAPNDDIPKNLKSVLQELHPSIRYFLNETIRGVSEETKRQQLANDHGCSDWNASNLRSWLTGQQSDLNPELYLAGEDPLYPWWEESTEDPSTWKAVKNGWFVANTGAYHHVAPASALSGRYIHLPPFIKGFTTEEGKNFVNNLLTVYNFTITDQNVHRYNRNTTISDHDRSNIVGKGTDHVGAIETFDNKFWLPSFEEIYGRRPVSGINDVISTTDIKNTTEGTQFRYFKEAKNFRQARLKYNLDGEASGWYLRSCDPTTVSRVFYVGTNLPVGDIINSDIETTCTAHRVVIEGAADNEKIGPAVCFTLGAPQN